jgi:hypothetical protein
MKAWKVYDRTEGYGYLVFAKTRNRGRALVRTSPGMDETEWTDICAVREKTIDGERKEECVLSLDDGNLYEKVGWSPIEEEYTEENIRVYTQRHYHCDNYKL